MGAKKKLGIGLVGCGFMGRTHSNAFGKVNRFFDLEYQPVLTAVCARNVASAEAFAENWGFTSFETDWRKLVARDGYRPHRHREPERHARRDRHRCGRGGQDGDVREAAWAKRRRVGEDGRGRRIRQPCRTWSGTIIAAFPRSCSPSNWSTRGGSGASSTIAPNSCRTGRFPPTCRRADAGLWRLDASVAGSGVTGDLLGPLHRHGDVAERADRHGDGDDRDLHQGAQPHDHGKVEPVTIDDASAFLARFHNGSLATFEATRYARGHKALYTLEINGADASIMWDLHDLHRLQYFDHSDEGRVRGWRVVAYHR